MTRSPGVNDCLISKFFPDSDPSPHPATQKLNGIFFPNPKISNPVSLYCFRRSDKVFQLFFRPAALKTSRNTGKWCVFAQQHAKPLKCRPNIWAPQSLAAAVVDRDRALCEWMCCHGKAASTANSSLGFPFAAFQGIADVRSDLWRPATRLSVIHRDVTDALARVDRILA
jgi:hypothetical protein